MSEPVFTREQLRAIGEREGDLLVAAGAGAGKTSVLVERFAEAVLTDGVAVADILAITFTEKAAAELGARIRARLAARGRPDLAREAEGAFISTIHGFCARLLRTHALAAGLDPEFEVLDALEAERTGIEAFDATLSAFLHDGAGPDRIALVAAYTPEKLEAMVRTAHAHLRSRGQMRPELPQLTQPRVGDEVGGLAGCAATALGELASAKPGKNVELAGEKLERCLELLAGVPAGELPADEALERLAVGRGVAALKTEAFDALRAAHEALVGLCRGRREYFDYVLLRELLGDHGGRYAELKRGRSALDFDDLELYAVALLRRQAAVRERWAGRFVHLLVDEFQDTNPVQNELIELLAAGSTFRVGDERQSIYRFRHADVEVFRGHARRAGEAGRLVPLSVNFRSRGEILDAINALFSSLWADGFTRLEAGPGARDGAPPADPCVELIVSDRQHSSKRWTERFEREQREREGPAPELAFGESLREVASWRAAEARLLARRIDELTGPDGPFEHPDVVVLVRATTHIAAYTRALEDRGIPTYVMGGRGYWSQQQVGDLRAGLATLANPLDGLALYTALASPLGGVSLDGLVLVRAAAGGGPPWRLISALADGGASVPGLGDADAERAREFVTLVRELRADAPRSSLETVIDRLVTGAGYDLHLLSLPQGDRRMANVRKLLRLAREFEAAEGRDLRGFIDFVAERDELGERQGEAPLEPEAVNAVRLMTVHRAKGLEFPVVCVADLGKLGNEGSGALRISDDGRFGLRLSRLGGSSAASQRLEEIKAEQREADEEEERRVFYVAATRAERHLVLSGGTDLEKLDAPAALAEPMRWVWRGLAPGLADIGSGAVAETVVADGRVARVAVQVITAANLDEVLAGADRAPAAPEHVPAGLDALDAPALAAVPLPAALPVSRISYSGLQSYARCGYRFYLEKALGLPGMEELRLAAPVRHDEPREFLPGTVRGSIVHELLEHFDFASGTLPGREAIATAIERYGEPVRDDDVDGIGGMVEGFAGSQLCARIAAAERTRTELPFAFTLAPQGAAGRSLLVNGVVDVHAREAGGTLVVDYKSDRLGERTPAETTAAHYITQQLVYALAALRAGSERVEVVHLFLERPAEPVSAVYEAAEAGALEARLLGLAEGIVAGRFTPSEHPHRHLCGDCPGRRALCSWPAEATLADPEPAPA